MWCWVGQAEGTMQSAETTKDAGGRARLPGRLLTARAPKTKPVSGKQVPSLPSLAKAAQPLRGQNSRAGERMAENGQEERVAEWLGSQPSPCSSWLGGDL